MLNNLQQLKLLTFSVKGSSLPPSTNLFLSFQVFLLFRCTVAERGKTPS